MVVRVTGNEYTRTRIEETSMFGRVTSLPAYVSA